MAYRRYKSKRYGKGWNYKRSYFKYKRYKPIRKIWPSRGGVKH